MRVASCFALLLTASHCSENVEVGYNAPSAGRGGAPGGAGSLAVGAAAGMSGGSGGGSSEACEVSECQGKSYRCGNCEDDDADGRIDSQDPDCLGPCDNTEDSYFSDIPGQNNASCRQDCYFDRDSGLGNDGCGWSQACDVHSVAPGFSPSGQAQCVYDPATSLMGRSCAQMAETQTPGCLDTCLKLTPNGCDCFGCCELPAKSGRFVWIGSEANGAGSCDAEHVADPAACRICTPVTSCFNACDGCEVCVGTAAPDPGCTGGAQPTCDTGVAACGPGYRCDPGEYCITGCCIPAPR